MFNLKTVRHLSQISSAMKQKNDGIRPLWVFAKENFIWSERRKPKVGKQPERAIRERERCLIAFNFRCLVLNRQIKEALIIESKEKKKNFNEANK